MVLEIYEICFEGQKDGQTDSSIFLQGLDLSRSSSHAQNIRDTKLFENH